MGLRKRNIREVVCNTGICKRRAGRKPGGTAEALPHGLLRLIVLAAVCATQLPSMQNAVKLRTDTRVVEIDVSVRDAQGKPVEDLNKSDFTITDDGKPRSFTIFTDNNAGRATPAPVAAPAPLPARLVLPPHTFTNIGEPPPAPQGHSTVILLDGINGWFDNYAYGRQGVIGMLNKVPADEKIALYVISKNEGLVTPQDYTLDRARLLDAITKYTPHAMCQAPSGSGEHGEGMIDPIVSRPPPPPPDPKVDSAEISRGARMAALKAVTGPPPCVTPGPKGWDLMEAGAESVRLSLNALADKLSRQPGRKSVFWISQGFPVTQLRGEFETLWNKTVSALNDANVAVNAIDSNGLDGPPRMWGFGEVLTMKRLAEDTGGQAYYGRNDLDAALTAGIVDSRSSYTLGFYLTEVDGKYHDLKVKVDRPGMALDYRQGYYALDEPQRDAIQKEMDATKKTADLATALLNPADLTAVGMVASLEVKPGSPRDMLAVRLRVDPDSLSLHATKAGRTGKVEEMFVEFSAAGREVGRITAASPFDIKAENLAAFEIQGIAFVQAIPLAADAVKLSIIVRDTESGRVGSLTVPIDK